MSANKWWNIPAISWAVLQTKVNGKLLVVFVFDQKNLSTIIIIMKLADDSMVQPYIWH